MVDRNPARQELIGIFACWDNMLNPAIRSRFATGGKRVTGEIVAALERQDGRLKKFLKQ